MHSYSPHLQITHITIIKRCTFASPPFHSSTRVSRRILKVGFFYHQYQEVGEKNNTQIDIILLKSGWLGSLLWRITYVRHFGQLWRLFINTLRIEANLVHYARARRNDEHVLKCLGSPLEKLESFFVALKLHFLVPLQSISAAAISRMA